MPRLDDVLLLAARTHWSEESILSMSPARLRYYINRLYLSPENLKVYRAELGKLTIKR